MSRLHGVKVCWRAEGQHVRGKLKTPEKLRKKAETQGKSPYNWRKPSPMQGQHTWGWAVTAGWSLEEPLKQLPPPIFEIPSVFREKGLWAVTDGPSWVLLRQFEALDMSSQPVCAVALQQWRQQKVTRGQCSQPRHIPGGEGRFLSSAASGGGLSVICWPTKQSSCGLSLRGLCWWDRQLEMDVF